MIGHAIYNSTCKNPGESYFNKNSMALCKYKKALIYLSQNFTLDIPGLSVSNRNTTGRGTEDPDLTNWLTVHGADEETINRVGKIFC